MKDLELALRLRRVGRPAYLNQPVVVSPRRFEDRGWLRVVRENWRYRRAYSRGGVSACAEIHRRHYPTQQP